MLRYRSVDVSKVIIIIDIEDEIEDEKSYEILQFLRISTSVIFDYLEHYNYNLCIGLDLKLVKKPVIKQN